VERSVAGIGRLGIGQAWAGFRREADGFRLVFGDADGRLQASDAEGETRTDELLAVAIAYFEEALDPPPPELEATQADLGELLRWLGENETDAARSHLLLEALDAVDDGLAGDVVVTRLAEARLSSSGKQNEQADVLDLLVGRYRALTTPEG
jgi:hypothetical protein